MRAKQPKRDVVPDERGLIEVSDYPQADGAQIQLRTKKTQCQCVGETAQALDDEGMDMERRLDGGIQEFESFADDVMKRMTRSRRQWGMRYPFETAFD